MASSKSASARSGSRSTRVNPRMFTVWAMAEVFPVLRAAASVRSAASSPSPSVPWNACAAAFSVYAAAVQ